MRSRRLIWLILGTAALGTVAAVATGAPIRAHAARVCSFDRYPETRDPSNPLALPTPPGANPLTGANFFVDGPARGSAARAIYELLGRNPQRLSVRRTWAEFKHSLDSGPLSHLVNAPGHGSRQFQIRELEKIASQPEAQRFSYYSGGGSPGAIYGQVQKILCRNLRADPSSVPIINTFFLWPAAGYRPCPTQARILSISPHFKRQIDAVAAGTGRHPAVFLLELDALGASSCMDAAARSAWEDDLRYEIDKISALPHTVVYVEGGYSDSNGPGYTANMLNAIGVGKIRGFFTNDTHMQWTINEVRWAERVSQLTGGAHYIVNTAQNGNGPKLNPHPVYQGIEDLCNPTGRALGPPDTTNTGYPHADAFMWTHPPGNSSGCGGGPASGTFWTARAVGLAAAANARLGPSPPWPSNPY
jgi:endoglucanase